VLGIMIHVAPFVTQTQDRVSHGIGTPMGSFVTCILGGYTIVGVVALFRRALLERNKYNQLVLL